MDWTHAASAGLIMKPIFIFATIFLLSILLCVEAAGAVTFTMEKKNSTSAYAALADGGVVYRGDTVRFTPAGAASYEWSFGDGFTSNLSSVEHTYAFGKRPIIMHNGFILLTIGLHGSDGTTVSHLINFTTPLPALIFESETIEPMNESLSRNFTEALTGNRTAPAGWSGFDWVRGINTTVEAYTSVLGTTIFLILVFSIPFIMNWIIMKDFIVSGILGGFLGLFIIARLPANMQGMAIAFIVMSVVAVIYSLLKET